MLHSLLSICHNVTAVTTEDNNQFKTRMCVCVCVCVCVCGVCVCVCGSGPQYVCGSWEWVGCPLSQGALSCLDLHYLI